MPGAVPGSPRCPGSSEGSVQLAPVSGPVCREAQLGFGSCAARGGQGAGQVHRGRARRRWVWRAWGGQVLESAAVAGFGATLPEPQVNRSGEKEQRKGWRASGPDRAYLAIPIRKTPGGRRICPEAG